MSARLRRHGGLCAGLLLGVACGEPGPARTATTAIAAPPAASMSPSARATASAAAPAARPSAADPVMLERLAAEAVYHDHFARRVLYTWTTAAQVDELTRWPTLLTRTESAKKGRAFFDRRRDQSTSAVARLFDEPALAKRRFAWANPWATLRGWEGESYGDRLIRVTLKDEAIIAVFNPDDPSRQEWRFFDLAGAPVRIEEVIRRPERIAAVYHVFAGVEGGEHEAPPYREYVLCNESMIASWEIGTERLREELAAEIDLLRRVRAELDRAAPERHPGAWPFAVARDAWPSRREGAQAALLYEASLAFANDRYTLEPAVLDEVIKALGAVPRGDPLEHRPSVAFPGFDASFRGGLPTTTPPGQKQPVKCFPQGTFGCRPFAGSQASAPPPSPPPAKPAPAKPIATGRLRGCTLKGTMFVCPPGKKP